VTGIFVLAALASLSIALGLAASFIRARGIRMLALALAPFMPVVVVLGVGLSQGCAGAPGGGACSGYSFGPAMAFGLLPGWIVLVILGTGTKRYLGMLL